MTTEAKSGYVVAANEGNDRKFTPEERHDAAEELIESFGKNFGEATTNANQRIITKDGDKKIITEIVYGIFPDSERPTGRVQVIKSTYLNNVFTDAAIAIVNRIKFGSSIIFKSWTADTAREPYSDGTRASALARDLFAKTGELMKRQQ